MATVPSANLQMVWNGEESDDCGGLASPSGQTLLSHFIAHFPTPTPLEAQGGKRKKEDEQESSWFKVKTERLFPITITGNTDSTLGNLI